jgi:hypothetical protein
MPHYTVSQLRRYYSAPKHFLTARPVIFLIYTKTIPAEVAQLLNLCCCKYDDHVTLGDGAHCRNSNVKEKKLKKYIYEFWENKFLRGLHQAHHINFKPITQKSPLPPPSLSLPIHCSNNPANIQHIIAYRGYGLDDSRIGIRFSAGTNYCLSLL